MIAARSITEWLAQEHTRLWGPLLEILVITTVIYLVLKFMQGTRGAGILRGMILFFVLAFLAVFVARRFVGMDRVSWVLENLLTLSVIGVIIIFQPEIRRALVRLGQNPLVDFFVRTETPVVDEIVKACANMAKRRVGALIAIQRRVGLGSYIEMGTRLDADVSADLINTVFFKDTPLHDGAIIVRGDRIAAAECLFPLTENPDISKDLGTRHRAAIGLTEESDAVVVIVSEQSGRISVAVKGELMGGLSVEDLSDILTDLCAEATVPNLEAAD